MYLYAKNPYEPKYQVSVKKLEKVDSKHYNDSENFIKY